MDYEPFPRDRVVFFADRLANEMDLDLAHEALQAVEAYRKGDLPAMHLSYGMTVRNFARHWGCGFDERQLEDHWCVLLKAAAERRLEPGFAQTISMEPTHPEPEDRLSGQSWSAFLHFTSPTSNIISFLRSFAFYSSGWYVEEVDVDFRDGRNESTTLQYGHYKNADNGFELIQTEYQGEPLPVGGAPIRLQFLDDGSSFMYGDYKYEFMGNFQRFSPAEVEASEEHDSPESPEEVRRTILSFIKSIWRRGRN